MNKAELVARVARDTGRTKTDVLRVLDAVLDQVARSLRRGEKVTLVDFGTFLVTRRRARPGFNPRTGEPMRITARRWPRFAAGKGLRESVRSLPERAKRTPARASKPQTADKTPGPAEAVAPPRRRGPAAAG